MKPLSSFYQLKSRILFRLSSVNRHGVHSPFVYGMLTRGIQGSTPSKRHELIKSQEFSGIPFPEDLTNRIISYLYPVPPFPNIYYIHKESVMLSYSEGFTEKFGADLSLPQNNGDLLLFPYPYKNQKREKQWKNLKSLATSHVIVECYTLGMIFYRQGQYPQEFKLRIG